MIKRIFWNPQERRLAMLWRLVLQTILMVAALMSAMIVFLPVQDIFGNARQTMPPGLALIVQTLNNILITAMMLLGIWLAGRWLDRRRFASFGVRLNRDWWIDFGFGLILGAFLMLVIFLVEWAAGWIEITGVLVTGESGGPFAVFVLIAFIRFVRVGVVEEFTSRGYHLKNLAEGFNVFKFISPKAAVIIGVVISSAVFGAVHLGNPNATWVSSFNIFLAGVFLAMGYILTGELAIPIAVHITWNFFQGNVFGFPVSGTNAGATFIAVRQGGPDMLTGGAFGPEAGLIGIAAIIFGSLLTVFYVRWRYGRIGLLEKLVVPEYLPRHQNRLTILASERELPGDAKGATDERTQDERSPDERTPDGRSQDERSQDGRSPDD